MPEQTRFERAFLLVLLEQLKRRNFMPKSTFCKEAWGNKYGAKLLNRLIAGTSRLQYWQYAKTAKWLHLKKSELMVLIENIEGLDPKKIEKKLTEINKVYAEKRGRPPQKPR